MLRVLIVEDSDTDHLLLQRFIKRLWPQSLCGRASNRMELLEVLRQCWDLIITDYHLFDIEGDELIATVCAEQPRTPCLILTGSVESLSHVKVPDNVFCALEKGDYPGLNAALTGAWQSRP